MDFKQAKTTAQSLEMITTFVRSSWKEYMEKNPGTYQNSKKFYEHILAELSKSITKLTNSDGLQ